MYLISGILDTVLAAATVAVIIDPSGRQPAVPIGASENCLRLALM